jgi:hypothetical protein
MGKRYEKQRAMASCAGVLIVPLEEEKVPYRTTKLGSPPALKEGSR